MRRISLLIIVCMAWLLSSVAARTEQHDQPSIPNGLPTHHSYLQPSGPQSPTDRYVPRPVKGQVLTSNDLPAVRIEIAKGFKYVGTQEFILYNVAHAEQHFFVDADEHSNIKRLYWIQFEGYLPTNTNSYRYKETKGVDIGGFHFIADAYARNTKAGVDRPDSDGSKARAFLQTKGYQLAGTDVLSQRLVHLVDEPKRNELMIIYLEDMSGLGLTAADVAAGGSAADRWPTISKELLDRAVAGLKLSRK